ncbi:MAG: hypothetical protein HZB99_03220 [Candidatus Harrisonbacteria bacterium]|nr:hypothetical protein [Candidatus Harrisonbacteria bacterium]
MVSAVLITSNALRHHFVANYLSDHLNLAGVVSEAKLASPQGATVAEDEIIKTHLQELKETEKEFFGGYENFKIPKSSVLEIARGTSNDPAVFEWVKNKNPEYLILFGSSIIKDPLLSYFKDKVINMHLGLSPYYRGSGTNFWPLVFREPECVGATIHLATLEVDAGAILGQVRPDFVPGDNCHTLGFKTVIAGTQLLVKIIGAYNKGNLAGHRQNLSIGKVFKKKNFNAEAVLAMRKNFETGMIEEYLNDQADRNQQYPIISPFL